MGNCWKHGTPSTSSHQHYPVQQNLSAVRKNKYINDNSTLASHKTYGETTDSNRASLFKRAANNEPDILNTMGNTIKPIIERAEKTGTCNLSKKNLDKIPTDLFNIGNILRTLDLTENKLVRIPSAILEFTHLKHLNLSFNRIVTLPNEIGELLKLETLNLASNSISSLPLTLGSLTALRDIDASRNELNNVNFSNNRISEVPPAVHKLSTIELNLNNNSISVLCEELSKMPRLKVLRLDENCLTLEEVRKSRVLDDSSVSLLTLEGNVFLMKDLPHTTGYDKYMERYTSSKKKFQ